jgi:hypothetical protein
VAHVAKELGVSRQCAHRWVRRFDAEGWDGLHDRSSRPHRSPGRTPAVEEARIVAERESSRRGPDWIAAELGVPARTVTRVLRRHHVPRLAECDPLTGQRIRATRHTTTRYERSRPGELVHLDVKKIGRIPDGGGWRAHGRAQAGDSWQHKKAKIGYDDTGSVFNRRRQLSGLQPRSTAPTNLERRHKEPESLVGSDHIPGIPAGDVVVSARDRFRSGGWSSGHDGLCVTARPTGA